MRTFALSYQIIASLKYLQDAATILAPQNRIQGRCELLTYGKCKYFHCIALLLDLNHMLCGMFDLYLFETIQFKFERRAIQNTSFMSATPQRNIL